MGRDHSCDGCGNGGFNNDEPCSCAIETAIDAAREANRGHEDRPPSSCDRRPCTQPLRQRSKSADEIVQRLIVRQGMSYTAAVRFCEIQVARIEREAKVKADPYREVVAELRAMVENSA